MLRKDEIDAGIGVRQALRQIADDAAGAGFQIKVVPACENMGAAAEVEFLHSLSAW